MIPFFKPGMRTYVLSGVALVSALLLQAHAQGVLAMAPMLKLTLAFILTVVAPLVLGRKYISTGRFTPLVGEYPLKNGILYGFC